MKIGDVKTFSIGDCIQKPRLAEKVIAHAGTWGVSGDAVEMQSSNAGPSVIVRAVAVGEATLTHNAQFPFDQMPLSISIEVTE